MLNLKMIICSRTCNKWYFQNFTKSSTNIIKRNKSKIQAWQIHAYGNLNEINLSTVRMPIISRPSEVIVKVEASSVNPIDISMMRGYGSKVFNLIRKMKKMNGGIEFPLTMGRDFSGTIVAKGYSVGEKLKVGDEVWGVVPVEQQGCHATHVIVDNELVSPKPSNLSYIEASSILYAGLTAWSSLWLTGGLFYKTGSHVRVRKVLILGGSGGVGSLAIQMAKAWNLKVVSTCSTDAMDQLKRFGADTVIDYKDENADHIVISEGIYDVILDCSNQGIEKINSKNYRFQTYITLNSPLLKNIDHYGLFGGAINNIVDLFKYNIPNVKNKSYVKWGFFIPSKTGINAIQKLVEKQQLKPVIEEVYSFEKLPEAYKRVAEGHLRGKVVIDMKA